MAVMELCRCVAARVPQAHHANVDSAAMHALRNVEDVMPSVRVGVASSERVETPGLQGRAARRAGHEHASGG